jgi:uncharacterized repeat protein (TIGR02543 family)
VSVNVYHDYSGLGVVGPESMSLPAGEEYDLSQLYGEHITAGGVVFVDYEGQTFAVSKVVVEKYAAITYLANEPGGQGGPHVEHILANSQYTIISDYATNISPAPGRHFAGWNTQADGLGTNYYIGQSIFVTDNLTLYAKWIIPSFILPEFEFGGLGGVVSAGISFPNNDGDSVRSVTVYDEADLICPLYVFDEGYSYKMIISYDVAYEISYNSNGGAGSMDSAYAPFGAEVTLAENGFSNAGYVFDGWNTAPDGLGASYGNGVTFTYDMDYDLVLYAQWMHRTDLGYVVHYYRQGSTTSVANSKVVSGQAAGVVVTEYAIAIVGYSAVAPTAITATLNVADNVFVFYYTQNSGSGNGGSGGSGGSSSGGGSTHSPSPSPSPSSSPSPLPSLSPSPSPSSVPEGEVEVPVWAFVNLVLSVAGLILAVLAVVWALFSRNQKQKGAQNYESGGSMGQVYVAKHGGVQGQGAEQEDVSERKQRRDVWLFAAFVLGIAGIIVFLLTEDMRNPMVMVDRWTIVNVVVFLAEILAIVLVFKRKKKYRRRHRKHRTNQPLCLRYIITSLFIFLKERLPLKADATMSASIQFFNEPPKNL